MSKNDRKWRREMDEGVSRDFNRFAGKQVNPANPHDPVLDEMRREAASFYSYLRLVAPGTKADENAHKITRINAELVDDGNGKWRIGNRFFRG